MLCMIVFINSLVDSLPSVYWNFLRTGDYIFALHPYIGVIYGREMRLSYKFYRLLDKRMHVAVVIDERNDLAIVSKDLLDLP